MAIVINGSGTVTGLAVGGLPDGTVDAGTLATDSVTAAKIAADSVDSAELIDGAVDATHLASGVVKTNTPSFGAVCSATIALSDGVTTKIIFDQEVFDNGGNFNTTTGRFTVPSGGAGDYIFSVSAVYRSTGNILDGYVAYFYKNGSAISNQISNSSTLSNRRNDMRTVTFLDTAADGDYYEFYASLSGGSGSQLETPRFTGFKLIE